MSHIVELECRNVFRAGVSRSRRQERQTASRWHQDAPPAFGTSLPPKWKACDPLAVVKTQLEFLARAQTEQNAHIEAQNTRVGRIRAIAVTNCPVALLRIV